MCQNRGNSKQVHKHLLLSERLTCVAHAEHATVLTVCPKRCAIIAFMSEAYTSNDLQRLYTTHACRINTSKVNVTRSTSSGFLGIMTSHGGSPDARERVLVSWP